MRWFELLLALSSVCWLSTTTGSHFPTASPWDSCSSVQSYLDSHPNNCFMHPFSGIDCYRMICSGNKSYLTINVKRCVNPASVYVECSLYGRGNYTKFEYVFQQSETVSNEGRESNGDTRLYTGVVARNASHLGFELYTDRDGESKLMLLKPAVYFPLRSARCMCESMKAIVEDFVSSYSCTLTNDECTELQCTVKDSILESLTMSISQCDDPLTVTLKVVVDNRTYTMTVTSATSKLLDHTGIVVTVGLWSYDYSIDLEIMVSNKDTKQQVLSNHQIILDLTSCGPPRPFDFSTAPPPTIRPSTYNTDTPTESPSAPPPPSEPNPTTSTGSEPTANTSLILSTSGTTCNAIQSIGDHINNRGTLNFNCVALNCIEIHCAGHNTTLNLSLSCSPIGMILGTADNATLFSQSGVFAEHIQLTVHNYNDTVLGFGLRVFDSNVPILDQQTVNYTLIPLHFCKDNELDSESKSLNCIAAVVVAPLMLVTVVILITVVYRVRHHRYRPYQLHPIVINRHHNASF